MRAAKEFDVDVRTHAQRAADRAATNGKLPRIVHPTEVLPRDTVTFWERIKRSFPTLEDLLVAGREVKGLVVTPTMGLTIVLAIATMMGGLYWRTSDQIAAKDSAYQEQRDMLVEIRTELRLKKESDERDRQRLEHQIGDLAAWQQVTNKDLARILPNRKPQN